MNTVNQKELNELKWRCRRGMREMDILLDSFLETHYENLTFEQQLAFSEMLDMQDPELFALLMHKAPASSEAELQVARLINPPRE